MTTMKKTNKALILIAGGSASGKTAFASEVKKSLNDDVLYIPMDMYYKSTSDDNSNFDTPELIDIKLLQQHIDDFFEGKSIEIPVYNFINHERVGNTLTETRKYKFVMIEGIFALSFLKLRQKATFKLFITAPSDIRLARRIKRDSVERGRSIDSIIDRWTGMVKMGYEKHIAPYRAYADLIIPWIKVNKKALEIFTHTLHDFEIPNPTK